MHFLWATHLRAADINVVRVGNLTYDIILTTYVDLNSVEDGGGNLNINEITFYVNGEEFSIDRSLLQNVGNETLKNEYILRNYKLASGDIDVKVFFVGDNRNAGIININNGISSEERMYIETIFSVSNFSPINSTPILATPPIDKGAVGQPFIHNPGAWDPDGDSLSFEVISSQSYLGDPDKDGNPKVIGNYRFLDDASFGDNITATIDPVTGTLVWDAPTEEGQYNIAIKVSEWRKGEKGGDYDRIGFVIRDMQIFIEKTNNTPPKLFIPTDTCVASGTVLKGQFFTNDKEKDLVKMTKFSGVFEQGASLILTKVPNRKDSLIGDFTWNIPCDAVRKQAHFSIIKAIDDGQPELVDLKNWAITVFGKAPENLKGNVQGKNIELTWDEYSCKDNTGKEKVAFLTIWRRSCDTTLIKRNSCEAGVPTEWGFEEIGEVSPTTTTFLDDNKGFGLSQGISYHYLISATYKYPGAGESYASDVLSIDLGLKEPLMTKVSVQKTDSITGEIRVEWIKPLNLPSQFKGKYTYKLYQAIGVDNPQFDATPIFSVELNTIQDTSFVVENLNTVKNAYSYYVELIDEKEGLIGQTVPVSSVRAEAEPLEGLVQLNIKNNIPWFYSDTLYQVIYRDSANVLTPLDSVKGNIKEYLVNNLDSGKEYCFVLKTRGVYCLDTLGNQIIENLSNRTCAIPQDNVAPCPPITVLQNPLDCNNFKYSLPIFNTITWTPTKASKCDTMIEKYNIYFKASLDSNFRYLKTVLDKDSLIYTHSDLTSYVGCYAVTALDRFDNESGLSNTVCNDNCPDIEFPNVFTPNDDGDNEFFIPIPTPHFVKGIKFSVYNRWGQLIHYSEDNPNLEWNGKGLDGNLLTDGTYYYSAEVLFDRLKKEDEIQLYKGWIYLVK